MPSAIAFSCSPMNAWSSTVTSGMWSYCSDLDIAVQQAQSLVPIGCINFGRCGSQGYYNNVWNPQHHSCCCCCCCVSYCPVCDCAIMTFAITMFFRIEGKPGVCSQVSSPAWSKNWIDKIQTSAFARCVCPVMIPRGSNSWLFQTVGFQMFFLGSCCRDFINTVESVQWFVSENNTMGSTKIKPIHL